ncbi:MAG: hypothetical protein ACFE94_02295 [Candidatus Hodarchaeota archaeon]
MTGENIDKTIERIMKEMRASPDYYGQSCTAHGDSQCSHEGPCDLENPKRLKKGIYCGVKPHCEQNKTIENNN